MASLWSFRKIIQLRRKLEIQNMKLFSRGITLFLGLSFLLVMLEPTCAHPIKIPPLKLSLPRPGHRAPPLSAISRVYANGGARRLNGFTTRRPGGLPQRLFRYLATQG
ncbi:uncharacterized protein LOC142768597 isoform X2 [Rhipicephalus microplus]|uniref:uncharacterized protein LOC142768597 isoform X2 n=1 Tax=Rhipicephalus microplus TaxID=6941 RepID=UPI003F6D12DA